MFFHIWGENTMIGATKCMDITKELYPYIFENSQKEQINFNNQFFFKNRLNYLQSFKYSNLIQIHDVPRILFNDKTESKF
jgi:hypothetical protein